MYQNAYIGGTFDCLHRGHLALFSNARKFANRVTVSVNTDEFAARYKRRPVVPLADRLAVLNQCRLVDRVVVNVGDEDSRPAILHAGADCIIHGSDWRGESLLRQMGLTQDWLDERRIWLVIVPYTGFISTTQIVDEAFSRKVPA